MVGDIDLVTAEQSPPPLSSGCDERVTFDLRALESMNRPGWELLGRYIRMIQASRRGFVDGYFPTMIARGVKARAVNLREWRP